MWIHLGRPTWIRKRQKTSGFFYEFYETGIGPYLSELPLKIVTFKRTVEIDGPLKWTDRQNEGIVKMDGQVKMVRKSTTY